MKLRAAILASDALAAAAAARPASSKDKDAGNASTVAAGPTVEAAPFQKVGNRSFSVVGLEAILSWCSHRRCALFFRVLFFVFLQSR